MSAKKNKKKPVHTGQVGVLMQGIKFRDCLIITCKGQNMEIFDKLGDYDTIMFPAIVEADLMTGKKIDHPALQNTRIDQLLMYNARPRIEGVDQPKEAMFFNKKPISKIMIDKFLNFLNRFELKKSMEEW